MSQSSNNLPSQHLDAMKYVVYGNSFDICPGFAINNPSIAEIYAMGEDKYKHALNLFIRKPYDIAVELDDHGIDYSTLTSYDLFFNTAPLIAPELSNIFFRQIHFDEYVQIFQSDGKKILRNSQTGHVIDEAVYYQISTYLRFIHFISEKVEYDMGNRAGRQFLIRRMRRRQEKLLKDYVSGNLKNPMSLSNIISYCVNCSGFKYNYTTVFDLKISQLYDAFYRLRHIDERGHLMNALYAGTIAYDKIKDKETLQIITDLHH